MHLYMERCQSKGLPHSQVPQTIRGLAPCTGTSPATSPQSILPGPGPGSQPPTVPFRLRHFQAYLNVKMLVISLSQHKSCVILQKQAQMAQLWERL